MACAHPDQDDVAFGAGHVNCRWRQRQGRPPQPRSPNGYTNECLYVVLKKHGQWRVDSVKTRVFGTEKWEVGIL